MKKYISIILILFLSNSYLTKAQDTINWMYKTSVLVDQKKYHEAYEDYIKKNDLSTIHSSSVEFSCALAYYFSGKLDESITLFEKVNQQKNKLALLELAKAYAIKKENTKAIDYLVKYLNLPSKQSENQIKFDTAFRQLALTKEWKSIWSKEWYTNTEKQIIYAQYLLEQNKDDEVYTITSEIIKKNKHHSQAYYIRSQLFTKQTNFNNALKDIHNALEKHPKEFEYLMQLAKVLSKLAKYSQAEDIYRQLTETNPEKIEIFYDRALNNYSAKKYEEAITNLTYYRLYFPNENSINELFTLIYEKKEDYIEALKYANRFIKNAIPNEMNYLLRGKILYQTNQLDKSESDFSMALDINPINGETYYLRGLSRIKNGNSKGACSDWNKAIQYRYYYANDAIQKYCR